MNFTNQAVNLMKRFSSGVSCPKWDKTTIKGTMFYFPCMEIAREKKKKRVDEETVKEYILQKHNLVTVKIGRLKKSSKKEIKNCMVLAKRKWFKWICKHGSAELFPITRQEAKFLKKQVKKLLEATK